MPHYIEQTSEGANWVENTNITSKFADITVEIVVYGRRKKGTKTKDNQRRKVKHKRFFKLLYVPEME